MLGSADSSRLPTGASLKLFANNRREAIRAYIVFVIDGVGKSVWNDLQY